MTYLHDILDPTELSKLVAERYISAVTSPDGRNVLYNYTERATYARLWTPETRQCRGLIVEQATGRIVCRPFDKFFNVGETSETALEALHNLPNAPELTEKLDGSMVAVWRDGNILRASTRGSFTSSQAAAALAWLTARGYTARNWPAGSYTVIGEWCAPDNRVVLSYPQAELRLIGARALYDGADFDYFALRLLADELCLPVVGAYTGDLAAAVAAQNTLTGAEGWVARWPGGFRVKIKTADYLRLHRIVSGFSAERMREALLLGEAERYMAELPEELRAEAESVYAEIKRRAAERAEAATGIYATLAPLLSAEGRKGYALAVQRHPRDLWPLLFALADSKPISPLILKALDLSDMPAAA